MIRELAVHGSGKPCLAYVPRQARELQELLQGRLSSVYLEQCRTVAPDFRARGRR